MHGGRQGGLLQLQQFIVLSSTVTTSPVWLFPLLKMKKNEKFPPSTTSVPFQEFTFIWAGGCRSGRAPVAVVISAERSLESTAVKTA